MILCQQNHLWAQSKLGTSNLLMKDFGCTSCCLAMINNRFGAQCTPDQVAAHVDWYTPNGLILWNKLNLKNAIFDWREYSLDIPKIKQTIADPERAVMICVQLPKGATHWMVVDYQNPLMLDTFYCDDPWLGLQKLSNHYGEIIGAAYFSKRVPSLP